VRVAAIAVVLAVLAGVAAAQGADVPALIDLIENQPSGMDRMTWKEQRRDAAKKLGQAGDKRAVPVLIDVVRTETFDIIGEIAIEALGEIGDQSAVPVLQEVAGDASRDTAQRDKAKKALKKLGAGVAEVKKEPEPESGTGTGTGAREPEEPGVGPTWGDDVLGASERLTFALGSATFDWNSVQQRLDFNLDVASIYERTLDKEKSAWAFGGSVRVLGATSNPEGRASSREVLAVAEGHGEYRAYWNESVYVIGLGGVRLEGNKLSVNQTDPGNDNSDRWIALDGSAAIGGGWGRVLDRGTRMRVARIAAMLEAGRQLGQPIDDQVARRLQSAWWASRGALGSHRRLTETVAILRESGILLGEPDASTTYELLQILDDPAYDSRLDGVDVHFAIAENYLQRWRYPSNEDTGLPEGRLEEVLLEARVGQQLGDTRDLSGSAFARYRLFAPDGAPTPWAIGAGARLRTFVYGDHYDARGVLDVSGRVGVSDDGLGELTNVGMVVGGEVGWTVLISRASSIRVAGAATLDAGELFLGARLEAAYGLLDGTFANLLN
jgi:hypothetical protein